MWGIYSTGRSRNVRYSRFLLTGGLSVAALLSLVATVDDYGDNRGPCGIDTVPPAPEIHDDAGWHGGAVAIAGDTASIEKRSYNLVDDPGASNSRETPQTAGSYDLDMKLLILSATRSYLAEPSLRLIKENLDGIGIPWDHKHMSSDGNRISDDPLDLEYPGPAERRRGKYMGIVLTSDLLAYQDATGTWYSSLSPAQWKQLASYEAAFGVRRVAVSAYPRITYGVEPAGEPMTTANQVRMLPAAAPFSSGLVHEAVLPLSGSFQNPAKVVDPAMATPIALFENDASNGEKRPVAATITNFPDGREQLNFYFAQSAYLSASYYTTALWVNWITRGIHPGKRRIYLNLQVDDLFMPNGMWNMATRLPANDGFRAWRATPDDLLDLVAWQKERKRRLPEGSTFRIEIAPNGRGVWEAGGYANDALFRTARKIIPEFHWVSHTFSHPDLDRISLKRLSDEVRTNKEFLADLIGDNQEFFSPESIVTPHISGLFNKEALRALYENGIRNVVGDNSRRELWPVHKFHGFYTSARNNGFEGIFVIPRQATVAPVSAGPVQYLRSFYNSLYTGFWGRELSSPEIMKLEAERVAKLLMAWHHDPYMFHQGNLWFFDWDGNPGGDGRKRHSLLSLWSEFVIDEVSRYMTLPVMSAKMDDMAKMLQSRMELDRCEARSWITFENGRPSTFHLTTASHCTVPVTGIRLKAAPVEKVAVISHETYGPDTTSLVKIDSSQTVHINIETTAQP